MSFQLLLPLSTCSWTSRQVGEMLRPVQRDMALQWRDAWIHTRRTEWRGGCESGEGACRLVERQQCMRKREGNVCLYCAQLREIGVSDQKLGDKLWLLKKEKK